jgi:ParB-like chromosome segregation protein Spo0J
VELREMSDREALIAMDIENRQRTDISPYERAMSYARWLSRGHFGSQDEIARALRISSTRVSRLLRLSRLPSVILNAFANPLEIREAWGLHIMDVLDHPHTRQLTIQAARALGALNQRPSAKAVYLEMIAASARGRQPKPSARVETVRDEAGAPLFRIRQLSTSVALELPREKLSAGAMAEIRVALAGILLRGSQNISESRRKRSTGPDSQKLDEGGREGPDDASTVNPTVPPDETGHAQDVFRSRSIAEPLLG